MYGRRNRKNTSLITTITSRIGVGTMTGVGDLAGGGAADFIILIITAGIGGITVTTAVDGFMEAEGGMAEVLAGPEAEGGMVTAGQAAAGRTVEVVVVVEAEVEDGTGIKPLKT